MYFEYMLGLCLFGYDFYTIYKSIKLRVCSRLLFYLWRLVDCHRKVDYYLTSQYARCLAYDWLNVLHLIVKLIFPFYEDTHSVK